MFFYEDVGWKLPLAAHETKFLSPNVYFAHDCYVGKQILEALQ